MPSGAVVMRDQPGPDATSAAGTAAGTVLVGAACDGPAATTGASGVGCTAAGPLSRAPCWAAQPASRNSTANHLRRLLVALSIQETRL